MGLAASQATHRVTCCEDRTVFKETTKPHCLLKKRLGDIRTQALIQKILKVNIQAKPEKLFLKLLNKQLGEEKKHGCGIRG